MGESIQNLYLHIIPENRNFRLAIGGMKLNIVPKKSLGRVH